MMQSSTRFARFGTPLRANTTTISTPSFACSEIAKLTARGESLASHGDGRGASVARRDDREYREYLREEQRSQRGCIARRMQPDFHHGLLRVPVLQGARDEAHLAVLERD